MRLVGLLAAAYYLRMSRLLSVHLLPSLFDPDDLRADVAVMIDVLRASTTIVHALAAGAQAVMPFTDAESVLREANSRGPSAVTGGERGGERIAGFDLDNSPLAYNKDRVEAKTVLFTTTNGTRALERCRHAERLLIGAFVNLSAVASAAAGSGSSIHLVCAGTDGEITREDALCAGAIVRQIVGSRAIAADADFKLNDEASMCADLYSTTVADPAALHEALRASRGGRNLVAIGFDEDIRQSARLDLFDLIPQYNPQTGLITVAA